MRGHILAIIFLFLFVKVHAAPDPGRRSGRSDDCISDQEAVDLIHTWASFFQEGFDPEVAEKTLADDFQSFSASQNFIFARNVQRNFHHRDLLLTVH